MPWYGPIGHPTQLILKSRKTRIVAGKRRMMSSTGSLKSMIGFILAAWACRADGFFVPEQSRSGSLA